MVKNKKKHKKDSGDDFYFDDCLICRAMKKAEEEGRELSAEELLAAFDEANKKNTSN